MSDEDLKFMEKKISDLLNKETELTIEVDESLIGGARFRIENIFLDASIKNQLKNIKSDLMKI
jgi:F0F1-type ATP synthase delta subunit